MLPEREGPLEFFQSVLLTVVGQAFSAAGYHYDDNAVKQAGGQFQFSKPLDDGLTAFVQFQTLIYTETEFAMRMPSRFRVTLIRSDRPGGAASSHPQYARRTLAELVVEDFGVAILPSADHWWTFNDTESLGKGLAEAGHLIAGYGFPWLDGTLSPDES